MNDNIGEQMECGSNLGCSQINEPVLSLNDMGKRKFSRGRWSVHITLIKRRK